VPSRPAAPGLCLGAIVRGLYEAGLIRLWTCPGRRQDGSISRGEAERHSRLTRVSGQGLESTSPGPMRRLRHLAVPLLNKRMCTVLALWALSMREFGSFVKRPEPSNTDTPRR